MIWTQLKVSGRLKDLENISAIVSMIDSSIMVEDYSDMDEGMNNIYGELIPTISAKKVLPGAPHTVNSANMGDVVFSDVLEFRNIFIKEL